MEKLDNYIELSIKVNQEFSEILIAELAEIGFESFTENEEILQAYILEETFKEDDLQQVFEQYSSFLQAGYELKTIEKENWNEQWETNYQPIVVADRCLIRSTFHKIDKKYPYEIIITPKMSFGTGHHETTSLMIENQLDINHQDKQVLDAGCGTAILSVFAEKLGANSVLAYDIDDWAVENSNENLGLNQSKKIKILQGSIETIGLNQKFNVILANINKNVLLKEIPFYVKFLAQKGVLILSGFYQKDIKDIEKVTQSYNLTLSKVREKNDWVSVIFLAP